MEYITPLIQTKLNRPVYAVDPVLRPRLTEWLDLRRERPLTLVSAPAGYGKSTLISGWVESLDCSSAWVTLDQYDNDLSVFLGYFIAAFQNMYHSLRKHGLYKLLLNYTRRDTYGVVVFFGQEAAVSFQ
jgi:LuxR family maltose regulon positive regulatory protein